MGESSSISVLCEFVTTDDGATLMGSSIRFDETGGLLSVQDAIAVIETISSHAAKQKMHKLIKENVVSEGTTTGFEKFKSDGKYMYASEFFNWLIFYTID